MPKKRRHKNKAISIKKYRTKQEFNIGLVLFFVVLLYLIITIVSYMTQKHVSIYEVREGSIINDNTYTGLVIRSEQAVTLSQDGYITYFVSEGSKVKKGSSVYAVSDQALDLPEDSGTETALTADEESEIADRIKNYNTAFTESEFDDSYSLKNEISTMLQPVSNQVRSAQLDSIIAGTSGVQVHAADSDGILYYSVDGMEDLTVDTFEVKDLERQTAARAVNPEERYSAGDPAYRLIRDESWSVLIPLEDDEVANYEELTSVRTRLNKDSTTLWASIEVGEKDGQYYACLNYTDSMIRYADERYLTVETILEDETGLKIPKSSVIKKNFYKVPQEYQTQGGGNSENGVLVQTESKSGNTATEFVAANSYYTDEDGNMHLDPNLFEESAVLVKPESSETYQLSKQDSLEGIYCVNKGYAVFIPVSILCENNEYYIVSETGANGLSNFDHIVLDGTTVEENEIVVE